MFPPIVHFLVKSAVSLIELFLSQKKYMQGTLV